MHTSILCANNLHVEPLEDCLIFLLAKANQQVQQCVKKRLAPYGITSAQYAVLRVLWERDGVQGGEISDRTRIDCATLTGIIDRLESLGLAVRDPHPTDRRANRILLTDAGRNLERPVSHEIEAINRDLIAAIGKGETSLRRFLERIGLEQQLETA